MIKLCFTGMILVENKKITVFFAAVYTIGHHKNFL
jgi:hypothetical protein